MFSWSIKKQVFAIVFLMTVVALIICGAGIYCMIGIRGAVDEINTTAGRQAEIDAMATDINTVIIGVREVVLSTNQEEKLANSKALEAAAAGQTVSAEALRPMYLRASQAERERALGKC
jgi:heme/copper-type cytochrome/quinol oxidase subunit 2